MPTKNIKKSSGEIQKSQVQSEVLPFGELRNCTYIRAWIVLGKLDAGIQKRIENWDERQKMQGFTGKIRIQEDIDSTVVQLWIRSANPEETSRIEALRDFADSFPINQEMTHQKTVLQIQDYALVDTDISPHIRYFDTLLYDINFKKLGDIRILFSAVPNNEFLANFFKHICYFELFYAKIERFYTRFKLEVYPQIRSSHSELIRSCSEIIDHKKKKWTENDLMKLSGWSLAIDELNFGLKYDRESIESNFENMKSRLRTIGADEIRYFRNYLEKAEFVLKTFEMAEDKNQLIKETILKNGISFIESRREEQKIANESERIHHIKNIKELVGGLAFIEIGINGIAEGVKIFQLSGIVVDMLTNTAFMRAVCILLCVIGYFAAYFYQRYRLYRGEKLLKQ